MGFSCSLSELRKMVTQGQKDSTVGKVFALYVTNQGLMYGIPYGPLSMPGMIFESIARNKP